MSNDNKHLDRIALGVRARFSTPRPVRRAAKGRRKKMNPYHIMPELRRAACYAMQNINDGASKAFLLGSVLGHAVGARTLSEAEFVQLVRSSQA